MTELKKSFGILGLGSAVPEKVLNNSDLEKMVDTSDEWITKRTGISERRLLEKDCPAYTLGVKAAKRALDDAKISASEIDMIIVTTSTPDYLSPSTACLIQKEIGALNAFAFDMNAACSGFVFGLTTAHQYLLSGYARKALVISCEGLTKVVDWEDRNTCVLFGDGAGAAVLGEVESSYGIISTYLGSNGEGCGLITIPCCYLSEEDRNKRVHENKRTLWMDGGEVFKFAVKILAQSCEKVCNDAGIKLNEIKCIVPHQANMRILEGAAKRLGTDENIMYSNLKRYGNISSASVPVALDEAVKEGLLNKGDYFILVGFGGGLTWASALLRWCK